MRYVQHIGCLKKGDVVATFRNRFGGGGKSVVIFKVLKKEINGGYLLKIRHYAYSHNRDTYGLGYLVNNTIRQRNERIRRHNTKWHDMFVLDDDEICRQLIMESI